MLASAAGRGPLLPTDTNAGAVTNLRKPTGDVSECVTPEKADATWLGTDGALLVLAKWNAGALTLSRVRSLCAIKHA